ncbi:hypothetical protein AB0N38_26170 [Micromonospora aurantiaca]|uniref:Uncharacterized protein n=1 Tax=Micromonospora aurantiaca (nom. illeg.) TaxID=47850 RepID=A0A6N3JWY6_9ACTN|nr:hypothetical protein [Micromonospora aurantiaca]AXH89396.1 hypothetical protein DVH21_05290 [Micromonospora aurantiaca]
MAFKSFSAGDVLTASDVNTYLMKQVVIVCTSASRPPSPVEGMTIYETDTDVVRVHDGSNWITVLHVGPGKTGTYRVGKNTRTADSGVFTTVEAAIDSVTVPLVSGRTYRVRWNVAWAGTLAGDTVFTRLRENNVTGTQLNIIRSEIVATGGAGTRWPATIEADYTAVATGNKTFVGTGIRTSGSGNINAHAGTDFPITMTVDYVEG